MQVDRLEASDSEAAELRERVMTAALLACGELGYRELTVAAVLKRYGGYRKQFYRLFGNVDECYAAAYGRHSGLLAERLLNAGAEAPDWQTGLRASLEELGRFAREQPLLGRGLLAEVHSAGEPTRARRREVLERLSDALDSARREITSRHSPPPLTAAFMVGAIEMAVVRALTNDDPELFEQAIPELERLVSSAYFENGAGAARA